MGTLRALVFSQGERMNDEVVETIYRVLMGALVVWIIGFAFQAKADDHIDAMEYMAENKILVGKACSQHGACAANELCFGYKPQVIQSFSPMLFEHNEMNGVSNDEVMGTCGASNVSE